MDKYALQAKAESDTNYLAGYPVQAVLADLETYWMTGDKAKLRKAIVDFQPTMLAKPVDGTYFTHDGHLYPLIYHWCREGLTTDEDQQWRAALDAKVRYVLGWGPWGPVTRKSDSDQFVGHLALADLGNYVLQANYHTLHAANAVDGTDWIGCSLPEMLAHLDVLLELAKGGEWVSSTQYNPTEVKVLLLYCAARGWDRFPKARQWLVEHNEQMRWNVTPDLRPVQHGDNEKPGDLSLWHRFPLMCISIGLGGDESGKLRHLAATLRVPDNQFWLGMYEALLVFDPRDLPEVPSIEHPVGLRWANIGLAMYRTRDAMLVVFCPNSQGWVDHYMSQWDVQLWHKGDWVAGHPIGYIPWGTNFNASQVYGLNLMSQYGIKSADLTADGCRIVMETKGSPYGEGFYDPPENFTDRRARTLTFNPAGLRTHDTFTGRFPNKLASYRAEDRHAIENNPPLQQFWHAPPASPVTEIANGFTWASKAGHPMKLTSATPERSREKALIGTNIGTYVQLYEEGGELLRFKSNGLFESGSETLTAEIESLLTWTGEAPIPPPPPPPVEPAVKFPLIFGGGKYKVWLDRIEFSETIKP